MKNKFKGPHQIERWQVALYCLLAVSLLINTYVTYKLNNPDDPSAKYPLLSKRIFAENQNDMLINFIPLRKSIQEYVKVQKENIGVYFEYLPSGVSIGVNDRDEIRLASLWKVPTVMSILKKVERKQLERDAELVIQKQHLDASFGNLWKKGEGTVISLDEAIKLALTESDNTAYNLLLSQLTGPEVQEVYQNLDILITINQEDGNYPHVSPKSFSSIFRSLYLSSFLSKEHSNYILSLLSQSSFRDKIPAGLPENIKVAHKIGVFQEEGSTKDLFIDCGIIYLPHRPYIVCGFVKGTDQQAQKHFSEISQIIYTYMTEVKSNQ